MSIGLSLLVARLAVAQPPAPVCDVAAARGIRAGDDGWIFVQPELNSASVPAPEISSGLGALATALAAAPTKIIVVVLPSRALATPASRAIPDFDFVRAEASHRALAEFFRSRGLQVIDALDVSREMVAPDLFFRMRDIHVSHAGAKRLSELVAASVRERPDAASFPRVEFVSTPKGRMPLPNEAASVLVNGYCGTTLPVPEVTARWTTERVTPLGLLDDEAAPSVMWWGTSNAAALSNLQGFLETSLQTPVLTLSTKGGGVLGSLYTAVRERSWPSSTPLLVFWEVSTTEYWRTVDGAPDPQDPAIYNEIVPAAWGSCTDAQAIAIGDWKSPGELLTWKALATPSYLFIEAEHAELSGVTIDVNGAKHRYEDYARTLTTGRYFWSLPTSPGPMRLVGSWTSARPNRVRVRVCPAPM